MDFVSEFLVGMKESDYQRVRFALENNPSDIVDYIDISKIFLAYGILTSADPTSADLLKKAVEASSNPDTQKTLELIMITDAIKGFLQ